MDDIHNKIMAVLFGDDWKEVFADPVRKAEIDKKLAKQLELKRLQWAMEEE